MPTYRLRTNTTQLFKSLMDLRAAVIGDAWIYRDFQGRRTLIAGHYPLKEDCAWWFTEDISPDERRALDAFDLSCFQVDVQQASPRYGLTPTDCHTTLAQVSMLVSTVPAECEIYRQLPDRKAQKIARVINGTLWFSGCVDDHEQRLISDTLAHSW